MVAFMLIYTWYLSTRKSLDDLSPHHDLWKLFMEKMRQKGLLISSISVSESAASVATLNDPEISDVFRELVSMSFEGKGLSVKEMKKKIRRL
jgi:hypothetical protein